jgi:phage tail sheath protein FI
VASPTLAPPNLSAVVTADGPLQLTWTATAGASFIVEESTTPWTWAGAEEIYRGRETGLDLYGRTPGRYLYRLRAETDEAASDWSPALVVDLPDLSIVTTAPADLGELADMQVAAMTACAGRGDLLAVLAGPAGQDAPDVAAHAEALRSRSADDRLLSFGALYHPWTVTVAGAQVPPDGAATGLLAAVAAERGCWREPANIPLAGVVALDPSPRPGDADAAEDAGTNLVQPQPHGLVTLAAATLSVDRDLGRIAVRRLLSLLRRLALRDGPAFVFEPQGEVLRRQVRRHFEAMLGQLVTRGAFTGPGPSQSFQVVVSGAAPDRLAVDLKVAPATELRFLTVRLVGAGNGVAVIEVV